jgi:hypothetical protein
MYTIEYAGKTKRGFAIKTVEKKPDGKDNWMPCTEEVAGFIYKYKIKTFEVADTDGQFITSITTGGKGVEKTQGTQAIPGSDKDRHITLLALFKVAAELKKVDEYKELEFRDLVKSLDALLTELS